MTIQDPTIIVDIDGAALILVGTPESYTIQGDNPEQVKIAKRMTQRRDYAPLLPGNLAVTYPTGEGSLLELAAALMAVAPGRAILVQAPKEVEDEVRKLAGEPGRVY